jgi:Flp pilus assembly protein TadG
LTTTWQLDDAQCRDLNASGFPVTGVGAMKRQMKYSKGQIAVIMTLVMGVLLGACGLGADVGVLYYNWEVLQKAADSAVLAGANYLTAVPSTTNNTTVTNTANTYAESNGISTSEIISTTVAADAKSVSMKVQRTVPYYFGRFLGLNQGVVSVYATAGINDTVSPSGFLPIGLPCTKANANAGADCNGTYKQYSNGGGVYNLHSKFPLGTAGSWGALALGGSGASTYRQNIIGGYSGTLALGDSVNLEHGNIVGPTNQGFDTRMSNASESSFNQTPPSTLSATDPQIILVPMVDFTTSTIVGFAEMYVIGITGNGSDLQVSAYFLQPLANNGVASNNPCSFGSGAVTGSGSSVKINSCTPVLLQ